ncbi:predicted protein [Naegleria gruberi]|uniref:Predicted protein n=1 Tax=Naegleria gruberi TaxID=5762 RepID=D2VQS8_NAEGR|nr:uncharacterized protein NAEGRDRAFT_71333 [Naegleria gruberi]EFC40760.1 predicted protein [Naegleria gruberi]|eukprot:XP_002673504.1 predicted protein [Naegleria gruberi strain NEG-M]
MSNKNLKKLKKTSSIIIPQKENKVKVQFTNNDWSLELNNYLKELMKQYISTNETQQYTVWKKNINGKPHKRSLEIDTNIESENILIDHQKQISLKSIKELNFNEDSDVTPDLKGFSILIQGMDSPIYYHFENELTYYSFVIQFTYSILKRSNLLYPSEKFCKFKIISDNILEEDSKKLNANVGIPFHFSMETFDIFGNPINSEETIWNAILYKSSGYFTDMKKNRKVQKCDLISHSQNISVFACTTNESGNYCLELSYIQYRTCCEMKFDMEFHSSTVSFKNSFVSFENGKSQIEIGAGESCKITMNLKDMFGNTTLLGFNPENVILQFFEKNSRSRWKWSLQESIIEENERIQVNYSMEDQLINFFIESIVISQLEIEVFYKNEKTESLIPIGVLESENISSIDNRLFCNIIPSSIHTIEIINLPDLKHVISLNSTIIKIKPLDIYGNEIQNIENLELEFTFKTENEEYHNLINENKFKLQCKKSADESHYSCEFIPEWSGIYTLRLIHKSKKLKEFSHEIQVIPSECEMPRLSLLKLSETQKKLKEKKDKIEEEILNFCKFKTFRQVLNYVIEKYHTNKADHASLLLCTTAERPEILKVYKKVIFTIHTDQSPLLKNDLLTQEESELITFELNTVFNAVQNAYQNWKKLA